MTDLRERQLAGLSADGAALLVVDVQRSFGDPAMLEPYGLSSDAAAAVATAVERCGELVAAARAAGVPVFWIELGTDPEKPWGASNWLRAGDRDAPLPPDEPCVRGTPGADWYRLSPEAGELRTRKARYSGFFETGLAAALRQHGIRWVSIVGLTTECCIAATATDAAQCGWPVLIADDATAAYDVELHEHALAQLALNVALIGSSAELAALWQKNGVSA